MHPAVSTFITVVCAVFASGGFWAWLQHRSSLTNAQTRLILGLAHDRLIDKGMMYIERGWITKDEYDDYYNYLYRWYYEFGGNGLAEKVYHEVKNLPVYAYPPSIPARTKTDVQ